MGSSFAGYRTSYSRCRTVGVPFCWLLPCTNASKIIIISQKVPINEVNLLMGRTISYCVWGLLTLILYLFIVVSFNQEYQYHTDIPVSIYIFVGYLFFCDMTFSSDDTMEAVFEAGCYLQL